MADSTFTPTLRQQVSLSFAYVAYSGLLLTGKPDIVAPKILKLMNKWMPKIPPLLTDGKLDWEIVWGPAIYSHKDKIQDNLMYVAQQISQPSNYVIAVRGTNPFSVWSWVMEDLKVRNQVPWQPGGPDSPKISEATQNGIDALLNKILPVKEVPGAGQGIEKFLGGLAASGQVNLLFTGHSLGGALSPTLALWFKQSQGITGGWDAQGNASISTVPFAGPTAGNQDFATLFNQQLGAVCDRIYNTLDIASCAWEMDLLEQLPNLYQPDIHMTRAELLLLDNIKKNIPVYIQPATGDPITWTVWARWKRYLVQAAIQHAVSYPYLLQVPELLNIIKYLRTAYMRSLK